MILLQILLLAWAVNSLLIACWCFFVSGFQAASASCVHRSRTQVWAGVAAGRVEDCLPACCGGRGKKLRCSTLFFFCSFQLEMDPKLSCWLGNTRGRSCQVQPCTFLINVSSPLQSEQKWKQLAELAISKCQFGLAQECLHHAQDYGGLLLLATASGNATMVGKLAEGAERDGKNNVAFMTYFLQGK